MSTAKSEPQTRMTVAEFIVWAMKQPSGRYELLDGEVVVAMASEGARHNVTKFAAARALQDGVAEAGLNCTGLHRRHDGRDRC